jgi:hypothetical protein
VLKIAVAGAMRQVSHVCTSSPLPDVVAETAIQHRLPPRPIESHTVKRTDSWPRRRQPEPSQSQVSPYRNSCPP